MLRTLLYALTVITSILVSSKLASNLVVVEVPKNLTATSNFSLGQIFSTTRRTTNKFQSTNDTNFMRNSGSSQEEKTTLKVEENSPSMRMIDSTDPIERIDPTTEREDLEIDTRKSNNTSKEKTIKFTEEKKNRSMEINPVSKPVNKSSTNESFSSSNSSFNESELQRLANSSSIKNIARTRVVTSKVLRKAAIQNEKLVSSKPSLNESTARRVIDYSVVEKIGKDNVVPLNISRSVFSANETELRKMAHSPDTENRTGINDVALDISFNETQSQGVENSSGSNDFTKMENSPPDVSPTSAIRNDSSIPFKPSYNESSFQKVENSPGIGNATISQQKENKLFPVPPPNYENETSLAVITMEDIDRDANDSRAQKKKIVTRSVADHPKKDKILTKKSRGDIHGIDYPFPKKARYFRGLNFHKRRETPEGPLKKLIAIEQNPDSLMNQMHPSLPRLPSDLSDTNTFNLTGIPWPFIPGPISCEHDFELEPSFVTKLGEFDYVVSVQRQKNPDEPPEHTCTGVIYNHRFILIAPHCLTDNYGLMVTSTDDLCTIDEMIDVDYVIEHKHYDPETKRNDIALLKLKSEIHKRAAEFPSEEDILGTHFYAVGFGELMWKSFPNKVGKLLQKVPVLRKTEGLKEAPGTLHITTSHMDLTGVFRGDFGGALVNLQGKFVGLKARFVKRSTEFEVYIKVRDYLPWIKSMVALHGS